MKFRCISAQGRKLQFEVVAGDDIRGRLKFALGFDPPSGFTQGEEYTLTDIQSKFAKEPPKARRKGKG